MKQLTALFCIIPLWVNAQPVPQTPPFEDQIGVRESSEGHVAEVWYLNAPSQNSQTASHTRLWTDQETGITFQIVISIQAKAASPEEVWIEIPSGEYIAVPEYAEVPDSPEPFIFQIMRPMF